MYRAHTIALDPTNVQATMFARTVGTARFAYNWALARWNEIYQVSLADPQSPKPNRFVLNKELNAIKRTAFPWMLDVSKCASETAITDLDTAFQNFFAKRARYPTFKHKGVQDSARITVGNFSIDGRRIRLPKIGWVRMREELRWPDAKLVSVTVRRHRGRWFAAVCCELPDPVPSARPVTTVGVDVGTREFVDSDGGRYPLPRPYWRATRHLRRAQQSVSRKKKGSKNQAKAQEKVNRVHGRVADIRSDWLHQTTRKLVDEFSLIGVEDLNVKGMAQSHYRALSVLDVGMYEFRRQLEYKAPVVGSTVVAADRLFPSTRMCSRCGEVRTKPLPTSVRRWTCAECGTAHDRGANAAVNLKNNAVGSTVSACGEFFASAGPGGSPGSASSLCEAGTRRMARTP